MPRVVISELNYHPYDPTPEEIAAGFTADDFEFVELQNVGMNTPDLVHSRFTEGIDFQFPNVQLAPGQYAVIVSNLQAFQLRYGSQIPVLGEYEDNLSNAGERITLVSATGDELLDFVYGDSTLWPRSADGIGASLQLTRPAGTPLSQLSKYYQWRGSTEFGGTPGRLGAPASPLAINEVLSNPPANESDAIELYNSSDKPVQLGGLYLSDSIDDPLKYQIPAGTIIPSGGYWVVREDQFDGDDAGDNGFGLNATQGDDLWLVVPDGAGGIAAFVDDVQFGAAIEGESFGRVPDGTGRLAPMTAITLGAPNAAPRVGPVVISEVHYHPGPPSAAALALDPSLSSGDLEFVEIHNPTTEPISLNNWRIRGGIDFDFAPGITLAANQTLAVVSFDPSDPANAARSAAFRTEFGLDGSAAIVGGFQGRLSNNSERVQLQRPGTPPPGEPQTIPRLLEDEVVYNDRVLWAVGADGLGSSLTRVDVTAWGNDPQAWAANDPSPGTIPDFVPLPGDSNRDRQFDQNDIVLVLQAGKYVTGQPATFEQGDWNRDQVFNQLDIVAALQLGHYMQGPYAAQSEGRFQSLGASAEPRLVDALLEDELDLLFD
jgi:hypothetical protein